MLPLPNIEEIHALLLELPRIVQTYELHDPTFAELVKAWLGRAEVLLERNRQPGVGAIAALRASVISAERGALPEGVTFVAPMSPRKVRDAIAAEALRRAEALLSDLVRADWAQLRDAERIIRQLVTFGRFKGCLEKPLGMAFGDYVNLVWTRFQADSDLAQGAVQVMSTVGIANTLVLLGRALPAIPD